MVGNGFFARLYQVWYESTLGTSVTEWIRRDFLETPLLYLTLVFLLGLWLGIAMARWRRVLCLWVALVVLIAVLIGHISKGIPIQQDFAVTPTLYLALTLILGLWLGIAVARWRRVLYLWVGLVVLVAVLIGDIFSTTPV